jgi:phosphoribosylamine---glycine ligase
MRILIVGNGGREHALLWKLRQDAPEASFTVTRPNGGMTGVAPLDLSPEDVEGISGWVAANPVDLVVVGPEAPLALGLVDRLQDQDTPAFGPTAGAARIEASKAFAKALMLRHRVPTARHATFSAAEPAREFLREHGAPVVVKASGLAAGKGAIVCMTLVEALDAVDAILEDRALGDAGSQVVIEEFMEGEELSVFALCDGSEAVTLLPAQDHKRVGERDTGPNTGGMGAYAPVSIASPGLMREVRDRILLPVLAALREEGTPFRGLLYAGLMLTDEGPRVVEFNCRFGDPETQVVLPLMKGSLLDPILAIARGESLAGWRPGWTGEAAVTTVLASGGYPGPYPRGIPIDLPPELEQDPELLVFHAGTKREGDGLVTSGGRVLAVTGVGPTLGDAALRSRRGAEAIRFQGRHFRGDIAWRELARDEAFRP